MCSVVPFAVRARCGLPGVTVLALFLFAAVDFQRNIIHGVFRCDLARRLATGRKKASLGGRNAIQNPWRAIDTLT